MFDWSINWFSSKCFVFSIQRDFDIFLKWVDIIFKCDCCIFQRFSVKVDIFLKWVDLIFSIDNCTISNSNFKIFFKRIVVFFFVFKQLSWYFLFQMSWYSLFQTSLIKLQMIFDWSTSKNKHRSTMYYIALKLLEHHQYEKRREKNLTIVDLSSLSINNRIIIIVWKFWNKQK